jgi:cell division protein FtsL
MFTWGREKEKLDTRTKLLYALSAILCLFSLLVYIYPSMRSTSLMYEYSGRLRDLEDLSELNKKLRLEVASMRAYDVIEKHAVEKLGLGLPTPEQVVIIAKR